MSEKEGFPAPVQPARSSRLSPADADPAGGIAALVSTARSVVRSGARRALPALLHLNRSSGFDCPGCAWPEPERRGFVEFCEAGAKHVAHEATTRRVDPEFFSRWSISKLLEQSDRWLEAQGRLTHPMRRPAGSDHYEPVSWAQAFERIADHLNRLESPNQAIFYTSGRTSNEAAFLYQLLVRRFGTNNLPDCSNLCHESSGTGLSDMIGVGKGTVSLADFEKADAIFVVGQNPGSNHPRMLTALEKAKQRGARIVSINPLRERGLVRFQHPQKPWKFLTRGTELADLFLPVRVGADVTLLKALIRGVLDLEDAAPGQVLDAEFIARHTEGFDGFRASLESHSMEQLAEWSGVPAESVARAARIYAEADSVITCWAMGITQHLNAVDNVQEIMNFMLLRGNLGKPGAGVCPVRGHSNVQGDRTMGIVEKPQAEFLEALGAEFEFTPPAEPGFNVVEAIRAMHAGRARVFFAMGGNLVRAAPDCEFTEAALASCALTVQVSTTLNRSHLRAGEEAIILPCLGRSERDQQASGPQLVSVEDSMSVVHPSRGRLEPASPQLLSEPAIVAGLARAVLGPEDSIPWEELTGDYDRIRDRIARVVPGFQEMNRKLRQPGGFVLPSGARSRKFETETGKVAFRILPLPHSELEPGELLMTTLRSHDQYNTTIYGNDDRYRGIRGGRRVVFLNLEDMKERELSDGALVDLTSGSGDQLRSIRGFRVVEYEIPRGCAATYFPEANPLVPLDRHADRSFTPAYKSVPIRLVERDAPSDPD